MTDYDSYDQLPAVAQRCRYFRSDTNRKSRYYGANEGVSCSLCRSWDGASCIRNGYNNIIDRLER